MNDELMPLFFAPFPPPLYFAAGSLSSTNPQTSLYLVFSVPLLYTVLTGHCHDRVRKKGVFNDNMTDFTTSLTNNISIRDYDMADWKYEKITPFSEKCSRCILELLFVYVYTSCPDTVLDSSFREANPRFIKSRIISFCVPL